MQPGELKLLKENERLKQEVTMLREQLKIYNHQEKLSTSRGKPKDIQPLSLKPSDKKSLSPKPEPKKSTTPLKSNYQHFAQKIRSIRPLNQDNYVNVKTTNTPPKTVAPKSTH